MLKKHNCRPRIECLRIHPNHTYKCVENTISLSKFLGEGKPTAGG
jgi:hypothetical protein